MFVQDPSYMSDESEDDVAEENREEMIYRRKYQMLLERCEILQQDNERLVHRIQEVHKFISKVRKEKRFLIKRLDRYKDKWQEAADQNIFDIVDMPLPTKIKAPTQTQDKSKKSTSHSSSSSKKSKVKKPDKEIGFKKHRDKVISKRHGDVHASSRERTHSIERLGMEYTTKHSPARQEFSR